MMNSNIRVRFAPSPTGHLHIGGLRSALFNWLFARHNKGTYLLRIEDTDLERSTPAYTQSILDSFAWTQLTSDEPVMIQSQRMREHQQIAQQLLEQGKAYKCYCTPEEVAARYVSKHGSEFTYSKYDSFCRFRSDQPAKPYALRFAVPTAIEAVTFNDIIRGTVTFERDQLEDFVIVRSDGVPLYNFVVVLDDAYMRISHIIRGEEHISNTPKQILLYQACGYALPQFAHLPMILGPSGEKLSKRDGAVSVLEYKNLGYLPDALLNYLARLGWAHGDQEIFSREQLISFFSLDAITKKGAIFDQAKLDWVNSVYIKNSNAEFLYTYIMMQLDPAFAHKLAPWDQATIYALLNLYKERVSTLKELIDELYALHTPTHAISETDRITWLTPTSLKHLELVEQTLEQLPEFRVDMITAAIKDLTTTLGIKLVGIAQPVRLALLGKTASPGVFELLALLGKQESLKRLRNLRAAEKIS